MVCKNGGTELEKKENLRHRCGTSALALIFLLVTCLGFGTGCSTRRDATELTINEENSTVLEEEENSNSEETNNESGFTDDITEPGTVETSDNGETGNQNEADQETIEYKRDELQNRNYEEITNSLRTGEKVQSADRETMISMMNALLVDRTIGCDEKICFNQLSDENAQSYAYSIITNNMLQLDGKYEDGGVIYDKEEVNKAVWDFYYGENIQWKSEMGVEDQGDYIKVSFADGDPWYLLSSCDISEDGDFYLVSGPCFYGDNGGTENIFEFYIDAVFEKNEESRYGVTLCYVETYTKEKNVNTIATTSSLADYKDKSYGADKLIDGDATTPWVEGVAGTGEGEQIIISLSEPTNVYGILLYNGYLETDDLHTKNGTVTKVSVDFGNGVVVEKDVEDMSYTVQQPVPDKIELEQSVMTDKIIITILDAQSGEKYDDTCIGEINLF